MKTKAMLALVVLGMFACLASASQPPSQCGHGACWRPPAAVLPESEGTSEREALVALFCLLDCVDSTAERGECQRGCLTRNINTTLSFQNCTEMCGNTPSCEEGCLITLQSPDMYTHISPAPDPHPVVDNSHQEGIYTMSLPTTGSGESENSDDQLDETYVIQVQDWFGNESYFTATSSSRDISLLDFACSEVYISYAVVTTETISEYFPPSTVCVFLPPGESDAAQELSEEFYEDLREGFLRHAVLTLSWERPPNFVRLQNYQLSIEYTPAPEEDNNNDCMAQDTLNITLDRELTNYTVMAENSSLQILPLYTCYYRVTLKSLPGKENVSVIFQIKYRRREREDICTHCISIFDPERVLYSITVAWRIANPLVVETIRRFDIELNSTQPQEATLEPEGQQMEFKHAFFIPPAEVEHTYEIEVTARLYSHLRWRQPIVQKMLECHVVIPPYLPPTSVLSATIRVEDIVSKPKTGTLIFNVSWEAPSNLNGDLSFYELRLGQEAVAVEEVNCTSPSTSLCVTAPEEITMANNCTPLELGPSGLPVIDIEYATNPGDSGVYLQVRTQNTLGLFSNWSDPIFVNVITTSSPSGTNTWIYGVIAAVVFLITTTLLFAGSFFVYRHYCFHRRNEFEEKVHFTNSSVGQ